MKDQVVVGFAGRGLSNYDLHVTTNRAISLADKQILTTIMIEYNTMSCERPLDGDVTAWLCMCALSASALYCLSLKINKCHVVYELACKDCKADTYVRKAEHLG